VRQRIGKSVSGRRVMVAIAAVGLGASGAAVVGCGSSNNANEQANSVISNVNSQVSTALNQANSVASNAQKQANKQLNQAQKQINQAQKNYTTP
jgi:uncharacterized membrane protein YfbV (UPF0208 family)